MAMPPAVAETPAPMADDTDAPPAVDASASDDPGSEDAGDENVLLTVCKEADGTYSLIKGDEEDADGTDAAGSSDTAGTPEEAGKQTFDSKGALLKAILDILNEDEASASGDTGSSEDQFQDGFSGASAPPAGAGSKVGAGAAQPLAQKY